ncbi:MAG: Unknown protein [uncultured Thiotrichaceae bacterium]|uniref:Uncharacterized protein n=1 Tax=uncultured Thiotrichaceae bacterium TaxID=298394 RepID=A0A6S6UCG7_9GAMM|nr:MAG: Unknown protein [uncultured Thiotrichaceae bacterium]
MGRTLDEILAQEKPEVVAAAEAKAAEMKRHIERTPVRSLQAMRGVLKGANTDDYRDRRDRF